MALVHGFSHCRVLVFHRCLVVATVNLGRSVRLGLATTFPHLLSSISYLTTLTRLECDPPRNLLTSRRCTEHCPSHADLMNSYNLWTREAADRHEAID